MPSLLKLPFGKKSQPADSASPAQPPQPEPTEEELKNQLCKIIIERYREMIENYEQKSVADLKGMVQPRAEPIVEIRSTITEGFHPYVYEEHFALAAAMAFEYASSFHTISPQIEFWLGFAGMQKLLAGDEIEKSILLCSILRALGSENAKVFVTDSKNAYVLFQFSGKSYIAEHSQSSLASKDSANDAMASLKGKILYAFNDNEWVDFDEGD